eukprot:TRINITY_DN35158_c0_g1_i3.p1 TRINITY_DN35158_c0_g1~~TRINITY_DN35158_c0_g1_i3.p1  ORF type:complete len:560 (+),score=77.72 TRINITY_DN35158_c0_g1_i3:146-1825(+)
MELGMQNSRKPSDGGSAADAEQASSVHLDLTSSSCSGAAEALLAAAAPPGGGTAEVAPAAPPTFGASDSAVRSPHLTAAEEGRGVSLCVGSSSSPRRGSASPRSVSPREARRVEDLPDLTQRLIREGLHEEYLQFRARYLMWRQGGASGAAGELGDLGTGAERQARRHGSQIAAEQWHPSPETFDFFFTVSYWAAITSIIGGQILTVSLTAPFWDADGVVPSHMKKIWLLIGDFFYLANTYLVYFEVINCESEHHGADGKYHFFLTDFAKLRKRVSWESVYGAGGLFFAMVVWCIAAASELADVEGVAYLILVRFFILLGGCGFFWGGFCEMYHVRDKPFTTEWWTALSDLVGGMGFFAGAYVTERCNTLGIVLYLIGGCLALILWESNDFGLVLLKQLNTALRLGGPVTVAPAAGSDGGVVIRHAPAIPRPASPSGDGHHPRREQSQVARPEKRLSTRAVAFLIIYCWLASLSILHAVASLYEQGDIWFRIRNACVDVLFAVVVTIGLTIHSAVPSVPNQQPYRLAFISTRFTLLFAAIFQSACLWHSISMFATSQPD